MANKKEDLERQINLTFAFISAESFSRKFLTQAWIRTNVGGYKDLSDDAFRKRLQRDLAFLRRVGVPIEQFSGAMGTSEGQQAYRLNHEGYELQELEFSPEEAAVLGLAGEMGHSLELGAFARSGWTKIAASGAERDLGSPAAVTSAGDLRALSAKNLDAILHARQRGHRIQFTYTRNQTESPNIRTMDIWGLVPERDRIYLVGFDVDRNAERCFRVTRVSDIKPVGNAEHPAPPETDLQELVRSQLRRGSELIDATLRVEDGRAVAFTSIATPLGDDRWRLRDVDRDWLVRIAAAHAPEAIVLEPHGVVDEIIALLETAEGKSV